MFRDEFLDSNYIEEKLCRQIPFFFLGSQKLFTQTCAKIEPLVSHLSCGSSSSSKEFRPLTYLQRIKLLQRKKKKTCLLEDLTFLFFHNMDRVFVSISFPPMQSGVPMVWLSGEERRTECQRPQLSSFFPGILSSIDTRVFLGIFS